MNGRLKMATIAAAVFAAAPAVADDHQPEWLFVQTATSATAGGDTLTVPYAREIFAFTDRPDRLHDYLTAHEFMHMWDFEGDNFTVNPPNAVVTWIADDEVREAEIALTGAEVTNFGRSITYDIEFGAGDPLPEALGMVSLFIDGVFDPRPCGNSPTPTPEVMCMR